jgi:hypothetical protein
MMAIGYGCNTIAAQKPIPPLIIPLPSNPTSVQHIYYSRTTEIHIKFYKNTVMYMINNEIILHNYYTKRNLTLLWLIFSKTYTSLQELADTL